MKERRSHHQPSQPPHYSRNEKNRFAPYRPRSAGSIQEQFKKDFLISKLHFQKIDNAGEYQDYVKRHQRAFFERCFDIYKKQKCWYEVNLPKEESYEHNASYSLLFDDRFEVSEGGVVEFPSSQIGDYAQVCRKESDCILVSNISPDMSLETLSLLFPGSTRVQLGLPDPQKQFYRYAWVHFPPEQDLESLLKSINLESHQLYACVSKSKVVLRGRISQVTEEMVGELESIFKVRNPQISAVEGATWEEKIDFMATHETFRNHFCLFCGVQAACAEELVQRCGHVHWRSSKSTYPLPDLRLQKELVPLYSQVDTFLPRRYPSTLLDLHFIRKIEDGKFQCRQCEKLFKGPEFVTKHYLGKHSEESDRLCNETVLYNQLREDVKLGSLLWPLSMLLAKEEHSHSSNNDNSDFSKRHSHPFPKREYKDWDAISIKEEPISY